MSEIPDRVGKRRRSSTDLATAVRSWLPPSTHFSRRRLPAPPLRHVGRRRPPRLGLGAAGGQLHISINRPLGPRGGLLGGPVATRRPLGDADGEGRERRAAGAAHLRARPGGHARAAAAAGAGLVARLR